MADNIQDAGGKFHVTEDGKLVEREDSEQSFSLEFDDDEDEE